MKAVFLKAWLRAFACGSVFGALGPASGQTLRNPVIFVTQVPVRAKTNTVTAVGGNHLATTAAAPRGGDLMIRYVSGQLKNLTRAAGYGEAGSEQGAKAIAVRDPCVHWSGERAIFSMVVGTAANARWQLYEVTGFGEKNTPIISKVPNQPVNYNNVQPCYSSGDAIIFVSDRPRNGLGHLYPARDEKGQGEINTGIWQLDPATGTLAHLDHSPSGSFDPFVDSFGRVVFSRWDHLQRDEVASGIGVDVASEEPGAPGSPGVWADLFPETLPSASNLLGHTFDQFLPWTLNQDGTGLVTINHLGRHELTPEFKASRPDTNLKSSRPPEGSVRAGSFLQMKQDPSSPMTGRFVSTDAVFTAVSAGRLLTFVAPPTRPPDSGAAVRILSDTEVARDPVLLTNGQLLASVARVIPPSINVSVRIVGSYGSTSVTTVSTPGTLATDLIPTSGSPFKIVVTPPMGLQSSFPWTVAEAGFADLNPGTARTVINTVNDQPQTFSGTLWELQPVEVVPMPRPPASGTPMETPELEVFSTAGVSPSVLRAWLTANDLAVISCRNVTTRDAADIQQPISLRVDGGAETLAPGDGPVYTVSALQFFQADYVRGYGVAGNSVTDPVRRVAARPMHDDKGANPTTGQGPGHVKVSTDGSMAAFVPAARGLSWQLEDPAGNAVVRERYWLSFRAGEIRSCTSCHGVNSVDQAGHTVATNPPRALRALLEAWKETHPEADAGSFRIWSEGVHGTTLDPAADDDGDGATNFEEFALGSSPLARPVAGGTKNSLEVTRETSNGQELNILTFTRSTAAYGLELSVELSDDMGSWVEAAYFDAIIQRHAEGFALETAPASEPQVETIRLTDLTTHSARRRFYRLRILAP